MAVCHKYSFMGRLSVPVAQARKAAVRFRCDDSKWKRSHGHNRGLGASCPLREGPQGCFICFHGQFVAPPPPAGHPQLSPFSTHDNLMSPTAVLKQQRRRALPLYSIVTGFDLWPTAPSPPNSALLLLL
ncbi:hypothetical protein BHM03_00029033 [Ensete ventricosum]|nr:hypothetical protein BHM03_00029033 [Ensete ventricosum]